MHLNCYIKKSFHTVYNPLLKMPHLMNAIWLYMSLRKNVSSPVWNRVFFSHKKHARGKEQDHRSRKNYLITVGNLH